MSSEVDRLGLLTSMCVCDWQEERLRRGDDLRLQMAIEESKREKLKPEEVCVCVNICPSVPVLRSFTVGVKEGRCVHNIITDDEDACVGTE